MPRLQVRGATPPLPAFLNDLERKEAWKQLCFLSKGLTGRSKVIDNMFLKNLSLQDTKRPSADKNRAAIDRLPRRWEKCVDSAGDSIE
jgi:hypothetical protein